MDTNDYNPRVADKVLAEILQGKGAVLVEGAKWCGKTTTCEQLAKTVVYMDEPKRRARNLALADVDPDALLSGEHPILIDEWQLAPSLWDTVRFKVDHSKGHGHFLLTGSAVPPDDREIHHTGTGRISRFRMRPMSLWESGESNGAVSLGALFAGADLTFAPARNLSLEEMAFIICRGGWPEAVGMKGRTALRQALDYVDAVANADISRVDGVGRDPILAARLLRSYARLQGTQAALDVIVEDMKSNDGEAMNRNTIYSYLNALRRIFVIEDMRAWHPNLRRKTTIRVTDTRYFADASIATAAMGLTPPDLMDDLSAFGFFFETAAVRDLRVYADALDGEVYHYLDRNGVECDAVVHLRNGRYGLVEIKLGGDALIDQGAVTLKKVESILDTARMRAPSFQMVLTAVGEMAYRRPDGVLVVPLGCLKP